MRTQFGADLDSESETASNTRAQARLSGCGCPVAASVAGELAAIGRELTKLALGYTVTRNETGGPPPAGSNPTR